MEKTPKILGILEIPLTIIEAHSNQVCMHGVHIQTHHTVLCVVNVPNEIKSGVNHMNHRKPKSKYNRVCVLTHVKLHRLKFFIQLSSNKNNLVTRYEKG